MQCFDVHGMNLRQDTPRQAFKIGRCTGRAPAAAAGGVGLLTQIYVIGTDLFTPYTLLYTFNYPTFPHNVLSLRYLRCLATRRRKGENNEVRGQHITIDGVIG